MLREKSKECYTPDGFIDSEDESGNLVAGSWRNNTSVDFIRSISKTKVNHASKSAEKIRDIFADHFIGHGQIPWQWNIFL